MKTCNKCSSVTFDDMEMCFDCMSSFVEPICNDQIGFEQTVAKLQVVLAGCFSYELLLNKLDGSSLSVGSASENAIVIPQEQVAARQLEVFYAHGHIWAENIELLAEREGMQATVDSIPLCGTVCIKPGVQISIGDALITVLEV